MKSVHSVGRRRLALRGNGVFLFLLLALLTAAMTAAGPISGRDSEVGAAVGPSREAQAALATGEPPSGANEDWWRRVRKAVGESEYYITRRPASCRPERGDVYQAPNRAHDLRIYFDERGVEVLDRSG